MSRVVVVTLPERGHYHPLLGPADALRRRGHDVAFACTHDVSDELRDAGVERVLVPPGAPRPTGALRGAALAEILVDPSRLAAWIRLLLVEAPRTGIAPLRALFRDAEADVVAIDTMAYDAAIAAELEGIPWVGWATSLNPIIRPEVDSVLVRTLRALDPERHALFTAHGLHARFRVSDVLSPRGTAVFAAEVLGTIDDATVHLVGPSLGGARGGTRIDPSFAEGRPILYVSFGSQAWHQPRRFARILDAAERTGWAVLASRGDLVLPPRRFVRDAAFVDQRHALSIARGMITHGGANSLMEGCAVGVPMLVAPICNDQPHGAALVARAGNGAEIDLERCSDEALDDALRAIHGRREAAMRVQRAYAERSGEEGAADLVEAACR